MASYTRLGLTLETHPDSSFNSGTWAGNHNYAEVSSAASSTVATVPTGIFSMFYNSIYPGSGNFSGDAHSFKYENGIWSDLANSEPHSLTNTGTYVSQTSVPDGEYIYLWANSTICRGRFESPYWDPPTPPPEEPATGTEGSGSCSLIYNAAQNHMQAFINAYLPSTDMISTRNLYYRVRNATNVSTYVIFNHYYGTDTYINFDPTVYGVYHLEKVLTNPLEVLICDSASVTQSNLDAFNAANTPPNTPRGRRGNLNFW